MSHRRLLVRNEFENLHHQLEVVLTERRRWWRKIGERDAVQCRIEHRLDLLPLALDVPTARRELSVELLEPVLVVLVHGIRRGARQTVLDGVGEPNVREGVDVAALVKRSKLLIGDFGRLSRRDVGLSGLLALVDASDGRRRSRDDGLKMDLAFFVLVDSGFDPLRGLAVVALVEVLVERVLLENDADLDIDASFEAEFAVAKPPAAFGHEEGREKKNEADRIPPRKDE